MGLDANDNSGLIFKDDAKAKEGKNPDKDSFSGLYVEKDFYKENNLEKDEDSIIFIEEDEDENR